MYDLAEWDLIICMTWLGDLIISMTWLGGFNYMYDLAGEI